MAGASETRCMVALRLWLWLWLWLYSDYSRNIQICNLGCCPQISCAGLARVDRAAVRPGGELLRDVESAAWPWVGGGGGPGCQGEWLCQENWIPPFVSFVWIKLGLLSKHQFIQQEVQYNYAQWTLELIKFSILTQEENVRRRVGSISLAGITGPEELELLEEEAHCESEVFVIFHHFDCF